MGKTLAHAVTVTHTLAAGTVVADKSLAKHIVQAIGAVKVKVLNSPALLVEIHPTGQSRQGAVVHELGTERTFGDFSTDAGQKRLAHAVYGFFNNGGARCFVVRMKATTELATVLEKTAAVDEIALVATPGLTDAGVVDAIVTHCKTATQDRFAIFDSAKTITGNLTKANIKPPPNSDYAAFYFPSIQVFDPATKIQDPKSDGRIPVPPSGHIAGIYNRSDTTRGAQGAGQ